MLSAELMGVFALGVLWVNTLLIAADAWKRHRELGGVAAGLRASRARGALVRARIVRGAGPAGAFATSDVEQLGRAMTTSGPQRILFTDRAMHPVLHGGSVVIDGREAAIEPDQSALVWCGKLAPRGDREAFDAAWPSASTFRGHVTTLARRLAAGDDVWIERVTAGEGVRLVACEDPEAVVQRARRPLRALVMMALGGATLVTVLALWPPVFGTISTLGGAAGLGFFLAIQPLGTRARDQALLPDRRRIGGLWQRPA
ncbi:MAG: hypothetical protein J0L92_13080 [Deltaproteobacteria bacterium]|nr:hypothetical protein [Deltaproteobacteria bacterium]